MSVKNNCTKSMHKNISSCSFTPTQSRSVKYAPLRLLVTATPKKETDVPKANKCKNVTNQKVLYLNMTNIVQGVLSQG